MPNNSRFPRSDELNRTVCCAPTCFKPPVAEISCLVPLCERHIFEVYKATNRFLAVGKAFEQQYALLPAESDTIAGPCPSCGIAGYLSKTVVGEVLCNNASCTYAAMVDAFERCRRDLLFQLAGTQEVVYYSQFRDLIKIGTSANLRERMVSINVERLLGFELGGQKQERIRHRQFRPYRAFRKEWFSDCVQLRAHINDVCSLA